MTGLCCRRCRPGADMGAGRPVRAPAEADALAKRRAGDDKVAHPAADQGWGYRNLDRGKPALHCTALHFPLPAVGVGVGGGSIQPTLCAHSASSVSSTTSIGHRCYVSSDALMTAPHVAHRNVTPQANDGSTPPSVPKIFKWTDTISNTSMLGIFNWYTALART